MTTEVSPTPTHERWDPTIMTPTHFVGVGGAVG